MTYTTIITDRKYEKELGSLVRHTPQAGILDYGGKTLTIVVPSADSNRIRSFLKEREMNYRLF